MVKKLKQKTKRSLKKRIKVTGTGKIMHRMTGKAHILTKKSKKRKRRLGHQKQANKSLTKISKKLIND